jgi:hypothetical protein
VGPGETSIALGHTRATTSLVSRGGGLHNSTGRSYGISISRKSHMPHIWILLHQSECHSTRATRLDISSDCHLASLLRTAQLPRNAVAKTRHFSLRLKASHKCKKHFKHGGCLTFRTQCYQKLGTLLSGISNLYSFILRFQAISLCFFLLLSP